MTLSKNLSTSETLNNESQSESSFSMMKSSTLCGECIKD